MSQRTRELFLETNRQLTRLFHAESIEEVKAILIEHLELELEELSNQYEQETGYALDSGGLPQEAQPSIELVAIPEGGSHSERSSE